MGFWDSIDPYLGPIGYGIDKARGKDVDFQHYLDPGDFSGRQAAKDQLNAGKEAQAYLKQLSDTAWARQMQGLQYALGSMNNLSGVMSNLYHVPTNYFDPSMSGGVQSRAPWESSAPPAAPPPLAPSTGPAVETRSGRGHF